ncbi:hypothetical protein [Parabacteroides sp.]
MRKKIAILPLLLLGLLMACDGQEELVKENPDYVEDGCGVLKLTINSSAATKAVGDALAGDDDVTLTGEKDIKSLAFFIHTEGTADGNGHFQKYFSGVEDKDIVEMVADETTGNYDSAILRFRSDAWQNPQVMVIANYKENGTLEKQLKAINSWEELKDVTVNAEVIDPDTPEGGGEEGEGDGGGGESPVSVTPKAPSVPLLMYTFQTISEWEKSEGHVGGGQANVIFTLQRLVSRIDIRNYANLATVDTKKQFTLESVEIINPNSNPSLMATVEQTVVPGEMIVFPGESAAILTDENDGHQYIDGLYIYENPNDDKTTATRLKIKGKLNNQAYEKTILLETQLAPVTPIALLRNHRYVVTIMPEAERQEVKFSIEVLDWEEGETLYAQPSFPAPQWEAVTTTTPTGFTWDANTKTLTAPSKTTVESESANLGTFEFKTTGNCATEYSVFYRYDYGGTSLTKSGEVSIEKPDWITRGTPSFTFESSKVVTAYTVEIPPQVAAEQVPLDILVCTRNANSNTYNDTLVIQYRPDYADTNNAFANDATGNKKPHLVGGKFWAPVNLGATKIYTPTSYSIPEKLTEAAAMTEFSAYTGLCYQWGRPVGFGGDITSNTTTNQATLSAQREITYSNEDDATKFIKKSGDWCSNDNGIGNNRWNSGTTAKPQKVKNDPCPRGWRIPTFNEMRLFDSTGRSTVENKYKKISEDEGSNKYMYLPIAGYYSGNLGNENGGRNMGGGRYYVADVANSINYMHNGSQEGCWQASACPIRCVQNDGPEIVETN